MPRTDLPVVGSSEEAASARAGETAAAVEGHHRTKGLVRLTMACDERCSFCNVPVEDHDQTPLAEAAVEQALADFAASGERTLTISGGEPTLLRKRLVALVASARDRAIPFVELQTNAVRIDGGYAEELRAAGLTSAFVSLLSHDAIIHDQLMGREGTHAACLRGIDALCGAGVAVTLNPVVTQAMQQRLGDYVDFVAQRLPAVRSISLSVVQPHGRAGADLELLPDYALLAPSVRQAHARSQAHGIELLNPYCGLPLCVGWESAQERSVEAIEAAQRRGASVDGGVGVDNRGDKRQGEPCLRCALRTRCGGAWHAYWELRQGAGLAPPLLRTAPWEAGAETAEGQQLVRAEAGIDEAARKQLAAASAPTVWLLVRALGEGDGARLLSSGCTDLALRCGTRELLTSRTLSRELREIARQQEQSPPQARLRVALQLLPDGSFADNYRALELACALGIESLRLSPALLDERWQRFVAAAQQELPQLLLTLEARAPVDAEREGR